MKLDVKDLIKLQDLLRNGEVFRRVASAEELTELIGDNQETLERHVVNSAGRVTMTQTAEDKDLIERFCRLNLPLLHSVLTELMAVHREVNGALIEEKQRTARMLHSLGRLHHQTFSEVITLEPLSATEAFLQSVRREDQKDRRET